MRLFGIEIRRASTAELSRIGAYNGNGWVTLASRHNAMLLSTVYRCTDLISDTIAMLPVKIYRIDEEEGGQESSAVVPARL